MATLKEVINKCGLEKKLAEKLIRDLFDFSPEDIFLRGFQINLSKSQFKKFTRFEKKILLGVPYQYVIGQASFYGYDFRVNKNVLIPRPETELMVERALDFISKNKKDDLKIVDIGTGSGCIIISLLMEIEKLFEIQNSKFVIHPYATDLSSKALVVAKKNAKIHDVTQIKFLKSDLLINKKLPAKFDLILANLPYLSPDYLDYLPKEETKKMIHEPKLALDGGEDGFEIIEKLIRKLPERLAVEGLAILEIDPSHAKKIPSLRKAYPHLNFTLKLDLNNFERFIEVNRTS